MIPPLLLRAAETRMLLAADDELGRPSDLARRFLAFHRDNPTVFDLVARYTLQMAARRPYYGIGAIFERVRWDIALTTQSDDDLKLNNNHRPYYARLVCECYPELRARRFFRNRRLGAVRQVPFGAFAEDAPGMDDGM